LITAVDSSVLSDVFKPDPEWGPLAVRLLHASRLQGPLVACDVVWAEIGSLFSSEQAAIEAMGRADILFSPLGVEAAVRASTAWRTYRKHGGPRERLIADFLIGAHALLQADRLLTRDRGFYRRYFSKLEILDPSAHRR